MRFGLITLFPECFSSLHIGITRIAIKKQIISLHYWNPRDYAIDSRGTVDDTPYGGGPGMVMRPEPLHEAITAAKQTLPDAVVCLMSPHGQPLQQSTLQSLAQPNTDYIIICGRYEGIDYRIVEQHIDREISLGDFILSGGEIAAMALIDGITRLLPGSLGCADSLLQESFNDDLLEHPHYTKPAIFQGRAVPEVLISGNHKAIAEWRQHQSLAITQLKRPDLLKNTRNRD